MLELGPGASSRRVSEGTVPALVVASVVVVTRARLPRFVAWGYLAATVVAFIAYFPFRQIPS